MKVMKGAIQRKERKKRIQCNVTTVFRYMSAVKSIIFGSGGKVGNLAK